MGLVKLHQSVPASVRNNQTEINFLALCQLSCGVEVKEENVCDKMVAKNFPCLSLLTVTHANALLQPKIYCQNLDSKTRYVSMHFSSLF